MNPWEDVQSAWGNDNDSDNNSSFYQVPSLPPPSDPMLLPPSSPESSQEPPAFQSEFNYFSNSLPFEPVSSSTRPNLPLMKISTSNTNSIWGSPPSTPRSAELLPDPLSILIPSNNVSPSPKAIPRKQRPMVTREVTKPKIETVSSNFDPLGFTAPVKEVEDCVPNDIGVSGNIIVSEPVSSEDTNKDLPDVPDSLQTDNGWDLQANAVENNDEQPTIPPEIESPPDARNTEFDENQISTEDITSEIDNASIIPIPPVDDWGSSTSTPRNNDRDPKETLVPAMYDPLGVLSPSEEKNGWNEENSDDVPLGRTYKKPTDQLPAPKYKFEVSVMEPVKVEGISPYMAYRVFTLSTHPAYRSTTSTVTRRYRDFYELWVAITQNNPGVVIPPVPEKQAVGRFEDDFLEARRSGLEKFLRKVTRHEILQEDEDLKIFLEEESFLERVKKKDDPKGLKLQFGSFIPDPTDSLNGQKVQLDNLESQLRTLQRAIENVTAKRREIAATAAEFSEVTRTDLATTPNRKIAKTITRFADSFRSVVDLYERRGRLDLVPLSSVVDEYSRTIVAIRQAHSARARALTSWHSAEANLTRKLQQLDTTPKIRTDKIAILREEIDEAEKAVIETRKDYDKVEKLVKGEVERTLREANQEIEETIRLVVKDMRDTQRQVMEIWKEFAKETANP
ncbi:Vacuolar protein sorting-associated protein 5 [Nowakowskiella sp. JEL0407]|nr:Vacuolar protein sorting-associated protein 5 [Nowakowskiella sp. JEL0407]